jgi:hypothetical protein
MFKDVTSAIPHEYRIGSDVAANSTVTHRRPRRVPMGTTGRVRRRLLRSVSCVTHTLFDFVCRSVSENRSSDFLLHTGQTVTSSFRTGSLSAAAWNVNPQDFLPHLNPVIERSRACLPTSLYPTGRTSHTANTNRVRSKTPEQIPRVSTHTGDTPRCTFRPCSCSAAFVTGLLWALTAVRRPCQSL